LPLVSRRVALLAAAGVVLLLSLVGVGRWERSHRADVQNRGIGRLVAEIGPLATSSPDLFRFLPQFQCLLYRRGADRLALELCADADGRVLEAIDRRGHTRIWSLRDDPSRATVRIDRAALDAWLLRLGLPPRYVEIAHGRI
jgi:hypothetical protein